MENKSRLPLPSLMETSHLLMAVRFMRMKVSRFFSCCHKMETHTQLNSKTTLLSHKTFSVQVKTEFRLVAVRSWQPVRRRSEIHYLRTI